MNVHSISSHADVLKARSIIRARDRETLDEQIRLVSIPAPTGMEAERGAYLQRRFVELGLSDVRVDGAGNVLGDLVGSPATGGPTAPVIVTAHLDTIFPAGTVVAPQISGSRVCAPGITDNARGLAALLAVIAAIRESGIAPERPVLFAGTVGEEGLGDLKGVKHLFRDGSPYRSAAAFISLDGAGVTRIVHRAIGARRLRATLRGLGGHSWGDRNLANPVHALGIAIASLRRIRPEGGADFGVNVGRVGGGTSVNAIPADAWIELDLRSDDHRALVQLEEQARRVLGESLREEFDGSNRGAPLVLEVETIGDRPCGETDPKGPLVQAAEASTRLLGSLPELTASSTDANVPMSLGIPALAMGAGGAAGGIHTKEEWYDNLGGVLGLERALLTVLAVAGIRHQDS